VSGRAAPAEIDVDQLESPAARLGWPFVPEHDLWFHRRLHAPRLRAALAAVGPAAERGDAGALAVRGRLRRLLGDDAGAAADLRAALDLRPGDARARCWLAELDLTHPEAVRAVDQALASRGAPPEARLYRAVAHLLRGDPRSALRDARAHAARRPRSALGALVEGEAHARLRRWGAAEAAFARAAELEPSCAGARLLQARAAARGLPRELAPRAAAIAEGALDADPSYGFIVLSWGAAGAGTGRAWRALLARMLRFAFEKPGKAGWYYRLDDIHYAPFHFQEYADARAVAGPRPDAAWAQALVVRGVLRCPPDAARSVEGLAAIGRAIRRAPWAGWMRAWRALALNRVGRRREALAELDASLRLQPHYHRALSWRGAALRAAGRTRAAIADLDLEVSIDQECAFSAHERSLARRALGDWGGAAADLDRAYALDWRYGWVFSNGAPPTAEALRAGARELARVVARRPSDASLRAWRGDLLRASGDLPRALAALGDAAALDPAHANAQAFLGRALLDGGRAQDAAAALSRAVALAPRRWTYRGWLAEAEFRAGRPARAWALIDEIIRGTPLHWWALHLLAELRLDQGDPREALKALRSADRFEGRHAEGCYLTARARFALGQWAAAEAAADEALAISPSLGRALLLRAEARRRRGHDAQAVADFRAALEQHPYLFNEEQRRVVAALLEG